MAACGLIRPTTLSSPNVGWRPAALSDLQVYPTYSVLFCLLQVAPVVGRKSAASSDMLLAKYPIRLSANVYRFQTSDGGLRPYPTYNALSACLLSLVSCLFVSFKSIHRNFQIHHAIVFFRWIMPGAHINLQ